MLKAKRIAKVMLCICIAFSMFISVNAISYNITVDNNLYTEDAVGNLTAKDVLENNGYKIESRYSGTKAPCNITINNIENPIKLAIWRPSLSSVNYEIINNIGESTIITVLADNNLYRTEVVVINVVPINNTASFAISTRYSDGSGSVFDIQNIYILQPDKVEEAVNSISNVFNNLINYLNSITSFITDKPWVILLGITVSLLSYLIYKAKSII